MVVRGKTNTEAEYSTCAVVVIVFSLVSISRGQHYAKTYNLF